MKSKFLLMGILIVVVMTGCTQSKDTENGNVKTEKTTNTQTQSETETQSDTQSTNQSVESIEEMTIFQTIDTLDLEGNAVTIETFGEAKLNVINVWATWC